MEQVPILEHINKNKADELTEQAHGNLMHKLTGYGNNPSKALRDAQKETIDLFSQLALGIKSGRYAIPLGCGWGKTQSVVAWLTALYQKGYNDISVAVCASQVEALCEIFRQLVEAGVTKDRIGLWHSYGYDRSKARDYIEGCISELPNGLASEAATGDYQSKQILLVTHSRVRGSGAVESYNIYNGEPRSLVIWDESLFICDAFGVELWKLENGYHAIKNPSSYYHDPKLAAFLNEGLSKLKVDLKSQQDGNSQKVLNMPPLSADEINTFQKCLSEGLRRRHNPDVEDVLTFLSWCQEEVCIFPTNSKGGAMITYRIVVDPKIQNMVILDASYNLRMLMGLNSGVTRMDYFDEAPVSYAGVKIHHLIKGAGKEKTYGEIERYEKTGKGFIREVAEVAAGVPENECILFVVFKPGKIWRQTGENTKINAAETLKKALERVGVDTKKKVLVEVEGRLVERPRINVLTWGSETGTNMFGFCTNVILVGILHRDPEGLRAYIAGQQDNLKADINSSLVQAVQASEAYHCAYQAASRGSCRFVKDDQAKSMNLWLPYRNTKIQEALDEVLPGAQWVEWELKHPDPEKDSKKIKELAKKIAEYVRSLPKDKPSVSSIEIKKQANMQQIPKSTFKAAMKKALAMLKPDWERDTQARSLVRADNPFITSVVS